MDMMKCKMCSHEGMPNEDGKCTMCNGEMEAMAGDTAGENDMPMADGTDSAAPADSMGGDQ